MPEPSEVFVGLSAAMARLLERDLRTPLRFVLGSLELFGMSELDHEQRVVFDNLMRSADGMTKSVDRLAALCRVTDPEDRSTPRVLVLPELMGAVAAEVTAEVSVRIDVDVALRVRGDEPRIRRLLAELLDNAVRHGRAPYALTVGRVPGQDATHLRLSVTDDGTGLATEQVNALTRPWGGDTDPGGDGVGLYLVRHTAAQLGGTLAAGPQADGRYAISVDLELPPDTVPDTVPEAMAADVADASFAASAAALASGPGAAAVPRRLQVLLVEDNAVNAILAQRQIKLLGHDLQTATRGADGVRAALDGTFDVILMDRHLPDLDGVQAAREIWAGEAAAERRPTPVIAVTADAMARNREECLSAGMDAVLTKPVDLDKLRAALDTVAAGLDSVDAQQDIIDASVLQVLAEQLNAPEMVVELRHAFIAELPLRRLRVQAAVRRSSAPAIRDAAEILRAASDTVGARRLAAVCRQIAEVADKGNTAQAHRLVPALRDACHLTSRALNAAAAPVAALV